MAGAASLLLSPISTMLDIYGQGEELKFNEAQSRDNEELAKRAAADAYMRGGMEAGRLRTNTTKLIGEQKVGYATSGVDMTSGTPASVIGETRMMGELDAQTIENNAVREAWGFKKKTEQIRRQRDFDRQKAALKMTATFLGGVGDMAGSAANMGGE